MWLTIPGHVRLRCVHAKGELVENTEISGARRGSDTRLGIVDEKRVLLSQEGCLAIWRVLRVPHNLSLLR